MALLDKAFPTPDFDDTSPVSEEEAYLGHKISALPDSQRRFFSDYENIGSNISLKKLDFENLVKETPFSRVPSQLRIHSSCKFTTEPSQTKLSDVSTCSSRIEEHSPSRNNLLYSKNVKFGDYSPNQTYTTGILKLGQRCRFPRKEADYQKELARHSKDCIPRWGKDWEALERKAMERQSRTENRMLRLSQESSAVCTEESETTSSFPCKTKKPSGFFKTQSYRLKKMMQSWKTQRGKKWKVYGAWKQGGKSKSSIKSIIEIFFSCF